MFGELVTAYLFLAGVGAGGVAAASVADLLFVREPFGADVVPDFAEKRPAERLVAGVLALSCGALALGAGCLLVSLEGFGEEGIADNPNRTLGLVYTRFFTRYEVCIFTPDRSFAVRQNPFSVNAGRSNVFVRLPAHHTFRVRGVRKARADALGWPQ